MSDNQKLIEQIAPYAMASQKQTGIPASVTIAQFIQESGWSLSTLATKFNNFFGIKSGGDPSNTTWQTTQEYDAATQTYRTEVAPFKVYANPLDSFNDHAKVLNNLGITGGDPNQIADKLQANGYATDPNYASSLKTLIASNNLTFYDKQADSVPTTDTGFWGTIFDTIGKAGTNAVDGLGNAIKGTVSGNPNPNLTIDPKTNEIAVKNADGSTTPLGTGTNPVVNLLKGDGLSSGFSTQSIAIVGIIILIVGVVIFGIFTTIKGA